LSKKFAALFFSLTVVILSTSIFVHDMSINFYTALRFLQFVVPSAVVMGVLGYFMGKIFEKSHHKGNKLPHSTPSKAQLNIDDLLNKSDKDPKLSGEKDQDI
jgi:hypothetical protein